MSGIRWFSLATLVIGLALLFMGLPTAGGVVLVGAVIIELIHAALTGKKTNEGME